MANGVLEFTLLWIVPSPTPVTLHTRRRLRKCGSYIDLLCAASRGLAFQVPRTLICTFHTLANLLCPGHGEVSLGQQFLLESLTSHSTHEAVA